MQSIIKSWIRYLIFTGILGFCMNLIYLAVPIYMMVVYDRVMFSFSESTLYALSLGVLISLFAMGMMDYLRLRILGQAGNHLAQKMMPSVLKSMQVKEADNNRPAYDRALDDLELLKDTVCQGHILNILDLPWVLIFLGILYLINPLLGGVAFVGVLMITIFQLLLRRILKYRYTIADVTFQANSAFFKACSSSQALVSGMRMLPALMDQYQEGYHKILAEKSGADVFHAGIGTIIRVLQGMTLAAVFGAGAFVFFTGEITIGEITAGVMIIARLFYPFEKNLQELTVSIHAMAAYKRLNTFVKMDKQKEILSLPPPNGKFDVEGVTLVLNGKAVLQNISFSLDPGESLGILAPSATGKSTLCRALMGILPAAAGKIRLDGAEIAMWPEDELGRYLGYMPQEPEMLPVSVAQNISRLGKVDSEKVVKAAQWAGVHEMILKLPQGYDTLIQGKNISVSQRQFISLARALYDDPKLVILDEPHTHLDDAGQKIISDTLIGLKQKNITTVVITNRPTLMLNMDKILVLKEGQVAMYGPGKEVINQLAKNQQPQQAAGV